MRRARLNRAAGSGRSQPRGRAPNSSVTVTGLFIALRSDGWNTKRRFLSIMKAICSGPGSRIAWKWRKLRVNETLVEAISLAHDLGHTPFGHAGQDALNTCMREYGGFEHNLQSLMVVDELEERYGGFNGLNLCFETREGILKH